MKKLKGNSPIPLYYQLREIIRDKIISEEWEYGTEIPAELKLCDEFNLCRATVKQALDGLVNEGLIVRKKGKGSFVVYRKIAGNFLLEPRFSKESSKGGSHDFSKVILADFVEADERILKLLHVAENEKICQITRMHWLEGEPVALDSNYISRKWAGNILEQDLETIAIYKFIENSFEAEFSSYKVNVQSVLLDPYEREQFDFPSSGTGMLVECLSLIHDEPAMFNRRIYRGDRCDLCFEFITSNQKMEVKNAEVAIEEKKQTRH